MSLTTIPPRAYTVRRIGGARHLPRAQWDALARRGYHRHAWFVTAEACGAEPRHVGVYEGRDLVAIIPAFIERETLHGDLHARWYGPAHGVARAIGVSLRPSLTIGAPMSSCSDPLGASDVLTEDLLDDAMEILEEEARAEHAKAIVWPFLSEDAEAVRAAARRRGYRESFASSEAVIDVEWSSAEEFLGSRSKNVNRTLRNELAWVHDQGIRVSWETDLGALADTFDAHYRASYVAHNKRLAALAPPFFTELAAQTSEGVRVQCAWRGTTLLAMTVALDASGELDLSLSAQTDETRNGLLHQHLMCYDPVRVAIAEGLPRIHLGPSALQPKIVRGAKLHSRLTLVRGVTPAARAALRVLAPLTDARKRAKQRRLLGTLASV